MHPLSDPVSFSREVGATLRELKCPLSGLVDASVEDRLAGKERWLLLLDYLATELQVGHVESDIAKAESTKRPEHQQLLKILVFFAFGSLRLSGLFGCIPPSPPSPVEASDAVIPPNRPTPESSVRSLEFPNNVPGLPYGGESVQGGQQWRRVDGTRGEPPRCGLESHLSRPPTLQAPRLRHSHPTVRHHLSEGTSVQWSSSKCIHSSDSVQVIRSK